MFGFQTKKEAKEAYLSNYEKGWKGCGEITPLTVDQFKAWLDAGDQKKPMAEQTFEMSREADKTATHPVVVIRKHQVVHMVVPRQHLPENTIKEATAKPDDDSFVKQADVRHLLHALADPAVRRWAESNGGVWPGFGHEGKTVLQALEDSKYQREIQKAMMGQNVPAYKRFMKGLYALSGQQWTPKAEEWSSGLAGGVGKIMPYLAALFGTDAMDAFAGSGGGTMGLTKAIADFGRHHGITPQQAAIMARDVKAQMDADPSLRYGFSLSELGDMMREGVKRGLISTTDDASVMARQLSRVAQPMAAIRDVMGAKGFRGSTGQLFQAYDRIRPQYVGQDPSTMSAQIRTGQFYDRMGGMLPASLQRSGMGGRMPNVMLRARDQQLRSAAKGSAMGNMAAAAARLEQELGFTPNSPAAEWMANMRQGNVKQLSGWDFVKMMEASGISQEAASSVLSVPSANVAYMTPEMVTSIRANQMKDFAPYVARLQRQHPGDTPEARFIRKGKLNQYAYNQGYRGAGNITPWQEVQTYHGTPATTVKGIEQEAKRYAKLHDMAAGFRQPSSWIQRGVSAVQRATPETSWLDFAQDVAGMQRIDELPGPLQTEAKRLMTPPAPPKTAAVALMVDAPETLPLFSGLLRRSQLEKQAKKGEHIPTVAVDLDGTIAKPYTKFKIDKIEDPRPGVGKALQTFKDRGWRVIIFTVRGDTQQIKDYLTEHEIPYDYINENPDQPENASGKVLADLYIDDRAVDARQAWPDLGKKVTRRLGRKAAAVEDNDQEGSGAQWHEVLFRRSVAC
jgi:hypothetical protein